MKMEINHFTTCFIEKIKRLEELLESSREVAEQRRLEIEQLKRQISAAQTGYET